MKTYRIHLVTKAGKSVSSDPLMTEGKLSAEEIADTLNGIVDTVGDGGYITMNVDGIRRAYLHGAIESIFWTDGS